MRTDESRFGGPSARASAVAAVARNTFREAVRDRVLYNLVAFALLMTAAAVLLGQLSASQEQKVIADVGLTAALLFGVLISIFVGTGLVYKEIERRTLYAILSKPVSRADFIVGKYLGLGLTLLVNVGVMALAVALAEVYVSGGWPAAASAVWPSALLLYFELMLVVAVAILFSSFSSPALSALLTFLVFVIGNYSQDLRALARALGGGAAYVLIALYHLLPHLDDFTRISDAGHGSTPSAQELVLSAGYAVLYAAALVAAAALVFARRNFK